MIDYTGVVVESSCGLYLIFEEITRIITSVIHFYIHILSSIIVTMFHFVADTFHGVMMSHSVTDFTCFFSMFAGFDGVVLIQREASGC